MKTSYEKVREWRKNAKLRMIMAFGGKCGICGYDRCRTSLVFHHLDPNEKEFAIQGKCKAWEKIVEELRKCIMLCSNCHGEVHEGVTEIPENIQRFDESYVEYKPKQLFDECPVCGEQKLQGRKTCSFSCARTSQNKIDWSQYDLKELYERIGTFIGVASYIGNISDVSVRKRMKKEGLLPL